MNKNIKDIIVLFVLAFGIVLIPTLINHSFIDKRTDTFFERVDEDFDDCVKNANENPKDIYWCKEIKRSSELAFRYATSISNNNSNISFIQIVLFGLVIVLLNLKRKIENLEKKINV